MIKDPDKAMELIEEYDDYNVPVFINCSIHGTEYPGTDARMQMIEYLAYNDSEERPHTTPIFMISVSYSMHWTQKTHHLHEVLCPVCVRDFVKLIGRYSLAIH